MNYWLVTTQGWRDGGLNEEVEWGDGPATKHLTVSTRAELKIIQDVSKSEKF